MTEESKPTYKYLVSVDDFIEGPGASWLIEGILPAAAQVIVYAQPRAFKTFVVLDMVRAVITGDPFCGHEVKMQGSAVYFALEGKGGARKRVRAALKGVSEEDRRRLLAVEYPFRMPDTSKAEWLQLRSDLKKFIKDQGPLRLIVIDTYARFSEVNESDSTPTSRLLHELQLLIDETGATVCLVHHAGKPTGKRNPRGKMRGSSALLGAADAVIAVDRVGDSLIATLICEKQKDFDEFEPLMVELEEVTVQNKSSADGAEPEVTTLRVKGRASAGAVKAARGLGGSDSKAKPKLDTAKTAILNAISNAADGKQHKELKAALVPSIVSEGTFSKAMRELEDGGLISKAEDGCWVKKSG